MAQTPASAPPRSRNWSLNSRATRGLIYQLLALVLLGLGLWYLAHNTQANMQARGIQSGFDFLGASAGFDIGETLIAYDPSQSYGKAIWVGVLNTIKVALAGIVLTTLLGVGLGVGRFSRNALVRGLCYGYVEVFRNVPLLLQLLMWYLVFIELLPPSNEALSFGGLVYLSKGGLSLPWPTAGFGSVLLGLVVGALAGVLWRRRVQKHFEATGQDGDRLWVPLVLLLVFALLGWVLAGMPREWNVPEQLPFMVDGGIALTPEFLALLIGLTTYTAAFVAEVVRGGVQSVGRGQDEAASALGLNPRQKMKLVVLPQAMRVIIPPLTNQYLNLTKNSSLAVVVGYPDVVSIANTTINQSGRAVECIAIIMLVYLSTSLTTSLIMNEYNRRMAIQER